MKFASILGEIFFPRRCLGCGCSLKTGVVCRTCFLGIPLRGTFFCGECGGELPIAMKLCHPGAPCLLGAAGSYDQPVLKALIHHLKFRSAREAAEPLAELMATFVLAALPGIARQPAGGGYLAVPIPLSRPRERERGYNQSAEIATRLCAKISLPAAGDLLLKIKHTKPQVETRDVHERQENLLGCFAVADPAVVAGKKILLIDDVTTSGSTFLEAARTLQAAGAKRILAVAAAKA